MWVPSSLSSQDFFMLTLVHNEPLAIGQNYHSTVPISFDPNGLWSRQANFGCYSVYLRFFLDFCVAVLPKASFLWQVQENSLIFSLLSFFFFLLLVRMGLVTSKIFVCEGWNQEWSFLIHSFYYHAFNKPFYLVEYIDSICSFVSFLFPESFVFHSLRWPC